MNGVLFFSLGIPSLPPCSRMHSLVFRLIIDLTVSPYHLYYTIDIKVTINYSSTKTLLIDLNAIDRSNCKPIVFIVVCSFLGHSHEIDHCNMLKIKFGRYFGVNRIKHQNWYLYLCSRVFEEKEKITQRYNNNS